MKHSFHKILFLIAVALANALSASAYDFIFDSIAYSINGNDATVTYTEGWSSSNYNGLAGDLVIPETVTYQGVTYKVTSVGSAAFYKCRGLTSVIIPNSVTDIGSSAFSGCSGLASVTIGNSVTDIGSSAFSGCSGLTSVNIPNSVTSVGGSAFFGTAWYNNQPSGLVYAGLVAYEYKGTMPDGTSIVLRDDTKGIADYAFSGCSGLTSVTIGNSVTSIGSSAFSGCSGLTSVNISDLAAWCNISFESGANPLIEAHHLFLNGTEVTDLVLPNSVTTICNYAFSGCSGLASVTIGNSVTDIGSSAFSGCSGLTSVIIPNSVTTIGYQAFYGCSGLTSVTIPNSVTDIGGLAFSGCSGLTSATIGNSVTDIGSSAFSGCSGLTSMDIPNSVTTIGSEAFSGCSGLASVTIGNSVTDIGSSTFYGCSGLTSVTIGNSVTSIGSSAFSGCSGLTSVNIPNSVTTIGDAAFCDCTSLTSVVVEEGNGVYDSRNNCNAIIEKASNTLITGCQSTIIPKSVTSIGSYAFYGCSGLTSVNIPNSVTTIGDAAFCGCSGLTSVTIPNSVTSIGEFAFDSCIGLTSVNISDLAAWCSISFGMLSNPLIWAHHLFLNGEEVTELVIPNSVTTIGIEAFLGCSGLKSVSIPSSVTSIYALAFCDCDSLTSVICKAETPPMIESAFSDYTTPALYVPAASLEAYQTANYWKLFENILSIERNITATPTISYNTIDNAVIITATGDGEVTLMVNGETVENPYTIIGGESDQIVTVTATAQEQGKLISETATLEVTIPAAENYFTLSNTAVFHGDSIVIPVMFNNNLDIIGFQTDVFLPEGFSIVKNGGEYAITPSARMSEDHVIAATQVANGSVRLVCYSVNNEVFTGESGDVLFYMTVATPKEAAGDYAINLCNSFLTDADYNEIVVPDASGVLMVNSFIPGDANDSHTVTVTDIVTTVQYILEMNPSPFIFAAADMNGDGNVRITDIALIARVILYPSAMNAPLRMPALWNNGDRLSGESISLTAGETRQMSITLANLLDYTAFQFDMNLPDGLAAGNFRLTDRAGSHALDVAAVDKGHLRVLCYSPALAAIEGNEGTVLTFDVTATGHVSGDITVSDIELVTAACQTALFDGFSMGVNNAASVSDVYKALRLYTDGRNIIVESPTETTVTLSDLMGRCRSITVEAGRTVIPAQPGVNIATAAGKTVKLMTK